VKHVDDTITLVALRCVDGFWGIQAALAHVILQEGQMGNAPLRQQRSCFKCDAVLETAYCVLPASSAAFVAGRAVALVWTSMQKRLML
jgi:hypothetical protein